MTLLVTNAVLHKYILKAVLPLVLHNRFIVDGGPNEQGIVCISFDCENSEDMKRIPSLSGMLKDNDVTTSFALRGDMVEAHENITKEILRNGHEIINHTFAHPQKFRLIDAQSMRKEIESFQELVKKRFCYRPEGFRAPHLMRKYDETLFQILRENGLYDSSYVGGGISSIDGVVEIPLTTCPDHPQVCFDYWHHFQFPLVRSTVKEFLRLWKRLLGTRRLTNIFLDPRLVSDDFVREMIVCVPDGYRFCRLRDLAHSAFGNRGIEHRDRLI
jgi:peptidoglycan/xylan/chitin deacetylase (PgdA/CDA1 family)